MKVFERSAQEIFVQMGINFGSGDRTVSQHFLYGTQIGAIFEQMRSK
jgi:hypothetical protein